MIQNLLPQKCKNRSGDGWSTAGLAVVVFGFVTRTQRNCGVVAFGFIIGRQQNCGMLFSFFEALQLALHCLYISLCSARPSRVLVFSFYALHILFLAPSLMEFLSSSFKKFYVSSSDLLTFSSHFLSPTLFSFSSPRPWYNLQKLEALSIRLKSLDHCICDEMVS